MSNKKTVNWAFWILVSIIFLMLAYVIVIFFTHGRDYAGSMFICLLPFMVFGVLILFGLSTED